MNITGTNNFDTLIGTDEGDVIVALEGNDSIRAKAGADMLHAGDGNDIVIGDAGDDTIFGGTGDDTLNGGDHQDNLFGSTGADSMTGGRGNDSIDGGTDNDTINAGVGHDQAEGGDGDDLIFGGAGNDTLSGGGGRDTLSGGDGDDALGGGRGSDDLRGGAGNDSIYGATGYDTVDGGSGNDLIFGGGGNDVIADGAGDDTVNAGTGNDLVVHAFGSGSTDVLNGNRGTDTLRLAMSTAMFNSTAFQTELNEYRTFLAGHPGDADFSFATGNLTVSSFEQLEVFVDGTKINLPPIVAAALNASATEDGAVFMLDLLTGASDDGTFLDVADISKLPSGVTVSGTTLSVDPTDEAFQDLADGQTRDITVTYNVVDGSGASVAQTAIITITGTNDAAVITGTTTGTVVEDSGTPATGTLAVSDVDGDNSFVAISGTAGTYGTYAITTAGVWTYTLDDLNEDVDALNTGETLNDSFTVMAADGTEQTVSITIDGYTVSAAIELSEVQLNTDLRGFVLNGVAASDYSGYSVSSAGDVNGDGFDDLIVGAYNADPNGVNSGASYVVFGKADGTAVELSAIASGTGGFVLNGVAASDYSGISVSSAGDVNGDGFDDLLVGAYLADPNGFSSGASYVVFGKADGTAVELSAIAAGTGGFVLNGVAINDYSGRSISGAGDVNGDGLDDLIVGANGADTNGNNSGASYVVFGKADGTAVELAAVASGTGGFVLNGAAAENYSGYSVSGAGDVNGDGLDDLIVGAFGAGSLSGASYVVFGKADGTAVELSDVASGTGGFVLNGVAAGDWSGYSVSGAGDVNGDGYDDLIVGARNADPNGFSSGASYVVFGKADGTAVELSAIAAGTGGFVLNGVAASDLSGYSVSGAGDVNGDGFDDLIVGTPFADPNGSVSGASYVVFGKADGTAVELSAIAAGTGGFVLNGVAAGDYSGYSVSGAGDVNGDGFDDLIVGAQLADPNGSDSGASYVVFGGDFTGVSTHLGTAGAEMLTGTSGDDAIFAGGGNDTISGGGGDDRLSGGQGDDLFIFANTGSATTIIDFEDRTGGEDVMDVTAFFASFGEMRGAISAHGVGNHDVLIQLDADDTVLLQDYDLADLTSDDFTFAI